MGSNSVYSLYSFHNHCVFIEVLLLAIERHPYPKRLIAKRKAALQFRFAQADFMERKYISGLFRLFRAFLLDPVRALRVLFGAKN